MLQPHGRDAGFRPHLVRVLREFPFGRLGSALQAVQVRRVSGPERRAVGRVAQGFEQGFEQRPEMVVVNAECRGQPGNAVGQELGDGERALQAGADRQQLARIGTAQGAARRQPLEIPKAVQLRAQAGQQCLVAEQRFHVVEAALDRVPIAQRRQDRPAQQPCSHRRPRAIQGREQGVVATAVEEIGGELQIALRGLVDAEMCVDRLHDEVVEVGSIVQGVLPDETDQSAGGPHFRVGAPQSERAQVDHAELAAQDLVVSVGVEVPVRIAVEHQVRPFCQHPLRGRAGVQQAFLDDQLARCQTLHVVAQPQLRLAGRQAGGSQLPGGKIGPRQRQGRAAVGQRRQVVVAGVVEQALVHDRSRGDHLDDPPLGQPTLGKPDLLADSHLASGPQQLRQVGLRGVMGNAAHRHAVAFRERDVQDRRGLLRVLGEHLVEVPEPKEQDRTRLRRLQAQILPHHGGRSAHPLKRTRAPGSPAA